MAELTFSVDSALLSELGEKLVQSPHIALVELVRNAYDADATEVTIEIEWNFDEGPDIKVVDNGSGMTFQEVKSYWMRIATTHKQAKNASPRFGRPRTGSKGIGRFACRRLGTHLKLETVAKVKGGYEHTEVSFPWLEFVPGEEISTITCEGDSTVSKTGKIGTKLIISGSPTDEWKKRGFDFLKRQLAVLTANRGTRRRGFEADPGFNVILTAPGLGDPVPNLRDSLLKAGWGDLEIKVGKGGVATFELNAMKLGKKTVTHPEKFPRLESVTAKIGIMPGIRDEMRDTSVLSKGTLTDIINQWGGVFVRHKGFRVYPFGEAANDWLNIDTDRAGRRTSLPPLLQPFAAALRGVNPQRALLSLLSRKNYIGDVEIGEKARGFEPKASREGFVGERAMDDLTELVRFGIDWSTIYREYFRNLEVRDEAGQAREELAAQIQEQVEAPQLIQTALRVVRGEMARAVAQLPTAERQEVLRSIKSATIAIEKHEATNIEERRHLQLVASTSTLLLIFSHEVKSLLSWFEEIRSSLDLVRKKVGEKEANKLTDIMEEFGSTKDRFVDLLSMTSLISIPKKAAPVKLTIRPRLEQALRSFGLIIANYGIDVDIDEVNPALQVGPMLEAELLAILLNLLSNSVKAVISEGGTRRIKVEAQRRGQKAMINIRDTGVGLDKSDFDNVFSPFASDPAERLYKGLEARLNPEDRHIVGTGSGLGLSIAREILNSRGGSIRFVEPTKGWSADIEMTLP